MLNNRLSFRGLHRGRFTRLTRTRPWRSSATLELVQWLDTLGYEEAWIGEHHSAGYEVIASPEVFIAAAAERTKHIRLGTGVSLPCPTIIRSCWPTGSTSSIT